MRKILSLLLLNLLFSTLTFSQKGLYFEYLGYDPQDTVPADNIKINSLDGNSIYERRSIKYPKYPTIWLHLAAVPDTEFHVYLNNTYTKYPRKQLAEYRLKVIGKEVINGFNCSKVVMNMYDSSDTYKAIVWVSNEIPSYEEYLSATINSVNLTKLNNALKKENLGGIPVRITFDAKNAARMDLVKTEFIPLDKSMFSLEGYSEAEQYTKEDVKVEKPLYKEMKKAEKKAKKIAKKDKKPTRTKCF